MAEPTWEETTPIDEEPTWENTTPVDEAEPVTSAAEAFSTGVGRGLPGVGSWMDELSGAVSAIPAILRAAPDVDIPGQPVIEPIDDPLSRSDAVKNVERDYTEGRDFAEKRFDLSDKEHPTASRLGKGTGLVAGIAAAPVVGGPGILGATATGALYGGLDSAGRGRGLEETLEGGALGTALGAGIGAGAGALTQKIEGLLAKHAGPLADKLREMLYRKVGEQIGLGPSAYPKLQRELLEGLPTEKAGAMFNAVRAKADALGKRAYEQGVVKPLSTNSTEKMIERSSGKLKEATTAAKDSGMRPKEILNATKGEKRVADAVKDKLIMEGSENEATKNLATIVKIIGPIVGGLGGAAYGGNLESAALGATALSALQNRNIQMTALAGIARTLEVAASKGPDHLKAAVYVLAKGNGEFQEVLRSLGIDVPREERKPLGLLR